MSIAWWHRFWVRLFWSEFSGACAARAHLLVSPGSVGPDLCLRSDPPRKDGKNCVDASSFWMVG